MKELRKKIQEFATERNWDQYHAPKNLAAGVSVEAGELLEIFMWLPESESWKLLPETLDKVRDEVGDVMIHLLNLCNRLDIDPVKCALLKLEKNRGKYPIEKSFNSARKYTDF